MKRRELITLLGGAAVARAFFWPKAAQAQQAKVYTIGVLALRRLWGLSGHRSASSIYEYTPFL